MTWVSGVVLYVIIWWTVLFAVLPIGVRPAADADKASGWRGAPAGARLRAVALRTSAVAAVLWLIVWAVVVSDIASFRSGWLSLDGD
jgi:predicted secreted protein